MGPNTLKRVGSCSASFGNTQLCAEYSHFLCNTSKDQTACFGLLVGGSLVWRITRDVNEVLNLWEVWWNIRAAIGHRQFTGQRQWLWKVQSTCSYVYSLEPWGNVNFLSFQNSCCHSKWVLSQDSEVHNRQQLWRFQSFARPPSIWNQMNPLLRWKIRGLCVTGVATRNMPLLFQHRCFSDLN